jgi:PTS system N-acetylgalactosamine-specific IIA component
MIGMIVSGHGHFASGLQVSAKMIAGERENVRYIDFEEGMGPDKLGELLSAAYTELGHCDGIVVLTDLPGGCPFQTAVAVSMQHPDKKIEVLAGTNLPMIVTAATMIEFEEDPKALADELITTGQECIVRFELAVREEEEEDEDGI